MHSNDTSKGMVDYVSFRNEEKVEMEIKGREASKLPMVHPILIGCGVVGAFLNCHLHRFSHA